MVRAANTVIFVSDNHAQSAAGCYGNSVIQTPALDSLAARGMRFDNAYCASPLCCPSRAALATGRFPHETGFVDNAIVYDGSVASWMHRARAAGCKVVSVGKLHFRSAADDNGFSQEQIPMHILDGRGGTTMLLRATGEEPTNIGQWELYTQHSGVGASSYQQYDRDITHNAITWLRANAQPQAKPWVLFVSYASPHPPFRVPPHIDQLYTLSEMPLPQVFSAAVRSQHPAITHLRKIMDTSVMDDEDTLRRITKAYYGLITHMDRQIGEVLGEMEALELLDCRIIYTSDHGEMLGNQGLFGKSCVFEGALKVPLILSGPDIVPGTSSDALVSHVDLFPTLLDSLNLTVQPGDADLQGRSLFNVSSFERDRKLFAEYHATGTTGGVFVLRQDRYKLIYHVGHPNELYDLQADPFETVNLAEQQKHSATLDHLITVLKGLCNPEDHDRAVKQAQGKKAAEYGGRDAIVGSGTLVYTPPPGIKAEITKIV